MAIGQFGVEQIRDDPRFTGREHFLRDLLARLKRMTGQRHALSGPAKLELEMSRRVGQHHEATGRAGDGDCGIEHERQYLVDHPAGSERAQAIQQACYLVQVGAGGRRGRDPALLDVEDEIRSAVAAHVDAVAFFQDAFGDRLAVDERAGLRAAVPQREAIAPPFNFCVVARNVAAGEVKVVAAATPNLKTVAFDGHGPRAECVGDLESGEGHGVPATSSDRPASSRRA
jgi:hypothetical protein